MATVSVIISSYNHAPYIGQAVQSVLDQTFQDFEILIADDASTDDTLAVLSQFTDSRIRVLAYAENRKAHMKNECLKIATGRYIAILNSDDYMAPDRLAKQLAFLETHADHLAVFSPFLEVDHTGQLIRRNPAVNQPRHAWLRRFIDKGNAFGHSCAMIRRDFFDLYGPYNRWLLYTSDFDLWVRICLHGEVHVIDEALTFLRVLPNESNLSGNTEARRNRFGFELPIIFDHFFSQTGISQLNAIFPDKDVPTETENRVEFLANYLAHHKQPTVRFRANQHLYKCIQTASEPTVTQIRSFYASVAHTHYDDKKRLPKCRFSIKKNGSGEEESIASFYLRYRSDITLTLEGTITEKSTLLFQPSDQPCVIHVKELTLSGKDCLRQMAVGGTAIKLKNGVIANVHNNPLIKLQPKQVPEGTFTFSIRFDLTNPRSLVSLWGSRAGWRGWF